jgi:endonuclease YncB( thermonuclease family)
MFKDEEFESYYTLAQRKAKIDRKGLWGENIFNSCIEEMYK